MKAVIVNYRGGKGTQVNNQMVLLPEGVRTKDAAAKLVGKVVAWTAVGKKKTTIKGKVTGAHGKNGAVRALFEKGMPGQSVGQKADIQ